MAIGNGNCGGGGGALVWKKSNGALLIGEAGGGGPGTLWSATSTQQGDLEAWDRFSASQGYNIGSSRQRWAAPGHRRRLQGCGFAVPTVVLAGLLAGAGGNGDNLSRASGFIGGRQQQPDQRGFGGAATSDDGRSPCSHGNAGGGC